MSDNDNNKCPLCGKGIHEDEIFCRDCREIAENAYPEEFLAHEDQIELPRKEDSTEEESTDSSQEAENLLITEENDLSQTQEIPSAKSNKKTWIFVAIAIVILIIVGIISSRNITDLRSSEEAEIAYWNKSVEENTPLGYSKYLVKYPEGQFKEEAYIRIRELRENEKKEWENLRNSNDVDALFIYLADNPESPYKSEIRYAIDSLAWNATSKQNTADAYLAYLENVKLQRFNGEYHNLAQERYDYLSQLKTIEGKELDELKKTLNIFFESFSSGNKAEFQKLSADTLTRFYTAYNQLSKNIIDSLKADYKKNKIRSMLYIPITDSIDAIVDNRGVHFVSVPVKTETTFINRRQKKENDKYNVKIEMDSNRVIHLLYKE